MEKGCLCLDCVTCLYNFHKFKTNGLRTEVDLRIYTRKHPQVKEVDFNDIFGEKLPIITNIKSEKDYSHYKQQQQKNESSDSNRYTCEICKFVYPTKNELTEHMFVHLSENKKPYQCKICKESFVSRWNCINHEKKHETEELKKTILHRYICHLCGRNLCTKEKYEKHIEYHKKSNANRYVCDVCKFVYHSKKTLDNHKFKHLSGDRKPFQCNVCNEGFVQRGRLIIHMREHTGERIYRCRLCQYTTKILPKFNEHIKETHKIEVKKDSDNNVEDSVNPFVKQKKGNKKPLVLNQYLQIGSSSSGVSSFILNKK